MGAGLRRLACLGLLLAALPGPLGAEEKGADEPWVPASVEPAAPRQLTDLRSPVLAHERRLGEDEALEIGGEQLRLHVVLRGRKVAWTRSRPGVGRSGIIALPGLLVLSDLLGRRYPLSVRPSRDGRSVLVSSAFGARLELAGGEGLLVDTDLDGRLGSDGDGYVAPQSRTVGPWRAEAWTKRGGVRFRRGPGGAWERAPLGLPRSAGADHGAAWSLLQWRRQQCGLLPLAYDPVLEAAMRKHADYLHRNGLKTHHEEPGRAGYTPEGDRAGRNSILGFGDDSLLTALRMQMGTLYHRTRILQPGLTHTALVLHRGIFLLNVFERRGGPLADALLVYPPHGMERVPQRFHPGGENPMPVAGVARDTHQFGTAVSVFSEPLRTAPTLEAIPTLTLVAGRRSRPVEAHLHYPGHPPSDRAGPANRGNVARIPERPLRARHRYHAWTRIVLPGGRVFAYGWSFMTEPE